MSHPVTKLSKLKAAWNRGDKVEALRIAAKFPRLGKDKEVIQRGWAGHQSQVLYTQMGEDTEILKHLAFSAIQRRYRLPDTEVLDA